VQLDSRLRFDNFVVGLANRLAVAAARAVAEAPGTVYNPLVIYSDSGLGKTHLMSAIGNQVMQRHVGLGVEFTTVETFVDELHTAISHGEDVVRTRYFGVGIVLLDDIQFLSGHFETQNELLRIFNALQADGRQIVMTSDRPPAEIPDVDRRLLTRLSGGLIVDIGAPDYETRMAILNAKCAERGVRFRSGVAEELGRIEFKNVRELQGALNRLIAYQTLGNQPLEARDVATVLGDITDATMIAAAALPDTEFHSFITDVASAVSQHVEQWKARIAEGIAYWAGEGYRTTALERVLQGSGPPPSVEMVLRDFEQAVHRLRDLQRQATTIDAALGANEAFLDPDRVEDARHLVERANRVTGTPPAPSAAFTRAKFEVGASNRLAARAADAVVAAPGARYNPLFMHGPSGVGKTHLLNAIGNGLIAAGGGNTVVACVSAQSFVDELIAALQDGTVDRWRMRYRTANALLIDDLQFIAGKERTQEELFHAFNALHGEGKQIVLASDCPPRELVGLEDRLRSRFEGGLVVQIDAPDRELAGQLFTRFLSEVGITASEEIVSYLSERTLGSVRDVIGMVNRIVAAAEIAAVPVTIGFVRAQLEAHQGQGTWSAIRAAADSFFLDDEKIVWEWPDPVTRLIEDLR
jgi:chromosomal replication initiator protein DnaA